MYMLAVVVPVRDEPRENVVRLLRELRAHVPCPYEVFIVYDRDDDTTVPVVEELWCDYPEVRLVRNYIAPGPSGALRTGFAEAEDCDRVLVCMADGSDDLAQIPALLSYQADVVCPSRYCPGGSYEREGSRLKRGLRRLASRLLRASRFPTSDPTNAFKLYRADLFYDVRLRSTTSFAVAIELVAKAHAQGRRIVEVPTAWRARDAGRSHFPTVRSALAYLPWFALALLGRHSPRWVLRLLVLLPLLVGCTQVPVAATRACVQLCAPVGGLVGTERGTSYTTVCQCAQGLVAVSDEYAKLVARDECPPH